jgi:hypothetical protein
MLNFDSIDKVMRRLEFVETISVIDQTLPKDPGRIIFPLTGLLGETEACVCFSCSGTALACQYYLCSITWF